MPFRVTMICFGCSSTGKDRIKAATSSAVFHLASWRKKEVLSESTDQLVYHTFQDQGSKHSS